MILNALAKILNVLKTTSSDVSLAIIQREALKTDWRLRQTLLGNAYKAAYVKENLLAGESVYLQMSIPENVIITFDTVETEASGPKAALDIIENPTFVPGDAAVTIYNANRMMKDKLSGVVMRNNVTQVDGGIVLEHILLPGVGADGGPTKGGDTASNEHPWIFAAGTNYIFRLINESATTISKITLKLFWVEILD